MLIPMINDSNIYNPINEMSENCVAPIANDVIFMPIQSKRTAKYAYC